MPLDLLHFGSGVQALHYFVLCFVAILGTVQMAAAQNDLGDLVWVRGRSGVFLGLFLVLAAFLWFFWVDEEIFLPGLAGGELFALFIAAFVLALPVVRLLHFLSGIIHTMKDDTVPVKDL
jgi:hypothetical protein